MAHIPAELVSPLFKLADTALERSECSVRNDFLSSEQMEAIMRLPAQTLYKALHGEIERRGKGDTLRWLDPALVKPPHRGGFIYLFLIIRAKLPEKVVDVLPANAHEAGAAAYALTPRGLFTVDFKK